MKQLITFIVFTCLVTVANAQNFYIQGKVMTEDGNSIPFASVFKTNSTIGTSANSEGFFKLSLPQGPHQLTVTAVGYQPKSASIDLQHNDSLNVHLAISIYTLQEVVIGNQEDPAYAIIRKAIKKRPH